MLEKYIEIWSNVKNLIGKDFETELIQEDKIFEN